VLIIPEFDKEKMFKKLGKNFLFQGSLSIFIFKIRHSEEALDSKAFQIPISKIVSSSTKKKQEAKHL